MACCGFPFSRGGLVEGQKQACMSRDETSCDVVPHVLFRTLCMVVMSPNRLFSLTGDRSCSTCCPSRDLEEGSQGLVVIGDSVLFGA